MTSFRRLGTRISLIYCLVLVDHYIVLIDAAERGQGITLGSRYLLDNKLKNGSLVRMNECSMLSGLSYYLSINEERSKTEEVQKIYQWLLHYKP